MNDVMTVCRDPFHSPHDKLLYVAKIAARGVHPAVAPDPDLARTCCRAILMSTKNPVTCARARYILYDLHVDDHDVDGRPIDEQVRALVRDITEAAYMNQEPIPKAKDIHVPRPVTIDDDPQNSHDSTVVSEVRRTIPKLRPSALTRTDIETMIAEADVSNDAKANALYALDTLSNETYSFDVSEYDMLTRVAGISDRETLVLQLASMIENGMPVCHTGKMSRLASCLDTGESETSIQPLWAVRLQAGEIASTIRREYLSSISDEIRREYETEGHDDVSSKLCADFETAIHREMPDVPAHIKKTVIEEFSGGF